MKKYKPKDHIKKSKEEEKLISIDYKMSFYFIFFVVVMIFLSFSFLKNYEKDMKENYEKMKNFNICEELKKDNSTLIQIIGDEIHLNNQKFSLTQIKMECITRNYTFDK